MGKECIYKLIVKIVFLCTQKLRVKYDKIVKIVPTNSVEVISFVVFRPKGRVMAAFFSSMCLRHTFFATESDDGEK